LEPAGKPFPYGGVANDYRPYITEEEIVPEPTKSFFSRIHEYF